MKLHKAVKMLGIGLVLTLGLLGAAGGGAIPLPLPPVTLETIDRDRIPMFFSEEQVQLPYPFEPLVELTVCPEGPPTCQFAKIQEAINVAPEAEPIRYWPGTKDDLPKFPLILIEPGTYEENLVILKSIWLRGRGRVILKGVEDEKLLRPTIFIAGPYYAGIGVLVIAIEDLTIEGGLQIVGPVSGLIQNNNFIPDPSGMKSIALAGTMANIVIFRNSIEGGGISIQAVAPAHLWGGIFGISAAVLIWDNDIYGSKKQPIWVRNAKGVALWANRIFRNKEPVEVLFSEGIAIFENAIEENEGAIYVMDSVVEIKSNRIERNKWDTVVLRGGNFIIEGNQITHSEGTGLTVDDGEAWIINNLISHNESYGIEAYPELVKECRGNKVFGNGKANYYPEELRKKCEGS